jgi:ABC-2 type transport system permease protein
MGWAELIRPASERNVPPFLLLLAAGLVTALAGGLLSRQRDFGGGLVEQRTGPVRWRAGIWGHTATLNRTPTLIWLATFVFLGFIFGLVTGTLRDFYERNTFVRQLLAARAATEADLTFTFVTMLLLMLSLAGGAFGIQIAARFAAEEDDGHADWLLSTSLSRQGHFAPAAAAALVAPAVTMAVGGVVLAVTATATGAQIDAGDVTRQALSAVPALWLTATVGLAFVGAVPTLRWIAWLLVVYWLILTLFGPLLKAPDWLLNTSPFHVIPRVTAPDAEWAPVWWILAITAALVAVGFAGYRARNIRGA